MSFWSKAGELAKNTGTAVFNAVEKSANETRELRSKLEGMDEDKLVKIVNKREGWTAEPQKNRSMAYSILKKRGYDVESLHNNT